MISKEDFELQFLDLDSNNFIDFFTENMDFIYHHYLKDEWFTIFAKPICGMYLYFGLANNSDTSSKIFCINKQELLLSFLIFIYNCLEYEDSIDIEELYSAVLITINGKEINKKTLDIHYLALELKQEYQETYDNMLYVFGMEKDVVEIEFYKHICPFLVDYTASLLNNSYHNLLVTDKVYSKHSFYGDNDNIVDWWGNIPENRYKSFDEKIKYFCLSLGGD